MVANWWTVWPWVQDREQRHPKCEVVVSVNQGSEHEQTRNGNGGRPGKGPQTRTRGGPGNGELLLIGAWNGELSPATWRCAARQKMMLGNKSV